MSWPKPSCEVKAMSAVVVTLLVTLLICTTILTFAPSASSSTTEHRQAEVSDALVLAEPKHHVRLQSIQEPLDEERQMDGRQNGMDYFIGDAELKKPFDGLMKNDVSWIPPSPLPEETGILTATSLPAKKSYYPEVGNGHIATVVRGDTIFMNGLYNGYNITSHRAMIDSSIGYRITSTVPTGLVKSFSLDLGRAFFTEAYTSPGVNISLRLYAHRSLTRVMVVELEMSRTNLSQHVAVSLALNSGCKSDDVDLISQNGGLFHWRTREAEYEKLAPRTDFYVKSSRPLQGTIEMTTGETKQSFLAISSIGVNHQRVLDQYEQAIAMFQSGDLLSNHAGEWSRVWKRGRLDVQGDTTRARHIYASLYYLYSSLPFHGNDPDWPFIGLSPGGLAHGRKGEGYNGHVFWDQDTWMFPSLAFLHSDLGKIMVETRTKTLGAAKLLANQTGYQGARYPWESAFTGLETCPAWPYSQYEVHINGDVAMMFRQYWQLTGDLELMTNHSGAEVVQELAKFWASRVTYKQEDDSYRIYDVMPPDEFYWPVNDSAYTNNIAVLTMNFANQISTSLGEPTNTTWKEIAEKMYLPYDAQHDYHPEFQRYRLHETTKQADVVLLNFPLMVDMKDSTRRNDLTLYEETIPKGTVPAMTWGMYLIGWLQLGNVTKAEELFNRSTKNAQEPFLVWTENADGHGAVNFITGMGGYLQSLVFGYGGCRLYDDHLSFNPRLIPGTSHVKFVDIDYRGFSFDFEYDEGNMTLTLVVSTTKPNDGLEVMLQETQLWEPFLLGKPITARKQGFKVRQSIIPSAIVGKRSPKDRRKLGVYMNRKHRIQI